jgi:ferrous iron transport protein B
MSAQSPVGIALAGNPNCGKTSLFNRLTGARQRVGNWPGVTVERLEGAYRHEERMVRVVDLPGVYDLDEDEALDAQIAREYLQSGEPQVVVNVVDASNLERNLYLTVCLRELGIPLVLALTMSDVAAARGLRIDVQTLEERLGCPVVQVDPRRGRGTERLRDAIERAVLTAPPEPAAAPALEVHSHDHAAVAAEEPDDISLAVTRYVAVRELAEGVEVECRKAKRHFTEIIDRIVLDRRLGIPIFLAVMYLMFWLTITVGGAFIDFFDQFVGAVLVDGLGTAMANMGAPEWSITLLADGVGGGIQTVATFIPIVGMLFLVLSALEDSGYMARAAFVMDRLMRALGLPGKAFVPLLLGFGCNVPAIVSTRTLDSPRDRVLTVMMNPFMSCGARLPVYALFAAAFFGVWGAHAVFGLYLLGILAAVLTGLVLKHTLLRGRPTPFVLELPPYHVPTARSVVLHATQRLRGFVLGAGKVIVLMVVVLTMLSTGGENSVVASASRAVTPALAPMGVEEDNWPAAVGIVTGIFAKEGVVGTLDSLYTSLADSTGEEEEVGVLAAMGAAFQTVPDNLKAVAGGLADPVGYEAAAPAEQGVADGTAAAMGERFDGAAGAFAYLVFILLYAPCAAAVGTIARETNGRWAAFSMAWTTGIAFAAATIAYQAATFGEHEASSAAWIAGVLAVFAITVAGLRVWGARHPVVFVRRPAGLPTRSAAYCSKCTGCEPHTVLDPCHTSPAPSSTTASPSTESSSPEPVR